MALVGVFSMVMMRTSYLEDNSYNWWAEVVLETFPKSDYISFAVTSPTVLVSYWWERVTQG